MQHMTSILIAGAGPTGLNMALNLARRRVPFRILSEDSGPGQHSRAMVVHARTLEFYRHFGFSDEIVNAGVRVDRVHLREGGTPGAPGHELVESTFADIGAGISPYPFALAYPQDDHERFLIQKLAALGIQVEWGTRLTDFTQDENGVQATIQHGQSVEKFEAAYLCGCDGARSRVREALQIGFPGGTYEQLFYVADAKIAGGFDRDLYVNLGKDLLSLMLPVRSSGMQRLIGLVPAELKDRQNLTFEDIRAQVEPLMNIQVTDVNWFSTYRVHHRVADRFRVGRAFLSGDAGHIHSPAGGQGMNTGIGDAMNLGWKLAHVAQGRADESLLDSYEPERIGFARTLVATTDRAFTPMVAEGLRGELTRKIVAPLFLTLATRFSLGRNAIFSTVSQTKIHYADSPLSQGQAGHVHGGDRLPWVGSESADNFAPLQSLDWQVHVYGDLNANMQRGCSQLGVAVHEFPWDAAAEKAGLHNGAMYLVRPDGYVALAATDQNAERLTKYFERVGVATSKSEAAVM